MGQCVGCVGEDTSVRRQVCAVGSSKETVLCGGCVEGDRPVRRVEGRRQVCAVGVYGARFV